MLGLRAARRLALARAGLLKPEWTGLPARARGSGARARAAAHAVIRRFGYLQLDTVSIAGARSHVLVLLARLEGLDPALGEALLAPGEPLFEYWGHEASWIPLELYPALGWRRRAFRDHPWWGDVMGRYPKETRELRARIRAEGALRSIDMEGRGSRGWWDLKAARKVAAALWSSGELAIAERRHFQRSFDLTERVIPEPVRGQRMSKARAFEVLLLRSLSGHGWASASTLAATFRLRRQGPEIRSALERLRRRGEIEAVALEHPEGRPTPGWIRPADRELAERLSSVRPRADRGVLLSPFDPLLWDRARVQRLFGFDQVLEIFKPAAQRVYGYYCLPVLAGERLVARVDLKAEVKSGRLRVLSRHYEGDDPPRPARPADAAAVDSALARYAEAVGLEPDLRALATGKRNT